MKQDRDQPVAAALLRALSGRIAGEVQTDMVHRVVYATDASSYREIPAGVVVPDGEEDLRTIIREAAAAGVPLIVRGAGTSLAGQVVGNGIIVDMRRFDRIGALDRERRRVTVEPGVIRDDLNAWLAPHGLQFGPETSTANRAFIGGMVGNNSCGLHSLVWGTTRDHLISCRAILSDGSEAVFEALSPEAFHRKRALPNLEGRIYETLYQALAYPQARAALAEGYPKPTIRRRNNGYALDLLARSGVFTPGGPDFNMCTLICGSEGTLCVVTEATLGLSDLPPPVTGLVTLHFHDTIEALRATLLALEHAPMSCELIGSFTVRQVIENNRTNAVNVVAQSSRWIEGEPEAIIVVELGGQTRAEVEARATAMVAGLKAQDFGYAWPLWFGEDVERIWTLRRLIGGVLSSRPSDIKPLDLIEDCAVDVHDQPEYVRRLEEILDRAGIEYTHSAHAGDGELHSTVFLNLKTHEGLRLYRHLPQQVVKLVKSFGGSLSGEHGDGRMRAEFLPEMIGQRNYELCCIVKAVFDPSHIFNPHKIVHALPMDRSLRYSPDHPTPDIPTYFNWDRDKGVLRAVERCNGIAQCKRPHGGLMCPSYMATRDEKDSTRGRANVLREFLTHSDRTNRFDHEEIREALDLCLSCKGCKSECPASVDMARLKAEFLQQYHDLHRRPFRSWLISRFAPLMRLAVPVAPLFNVAAASALARPVKRLIGFAPARSLPLLSRETLARWDRRHPRPPLASPTGRVHLFCDEFTDLNDAPAGIAAVKLLTALGYDVILVSGGESGRALISQGFLKKARTVADTNVARLEAQVSEAAPLVAIEPSAISCFQDEYPDLVSPPLRDAATRLAKSSLTFETFIARQAARGAIRPDHFTDDARMVRVHVHCHQKSLSPVDDVLRALSLPPNYTVENIPSGCCGMAGAFGYEREHFDISMRIGEQVLLPAVRAAADDTIIAASGTSCRHQIRDATGRDAKHSAEILYEALRTKAALSPRVRHGQARRHGRQ
ncbi:MAG: FAD-binding and (Fe-S)-binding domain-containing protein [Tropicimonas sp.]|uniref:FAD-binding and (Fe-S)-binding domain-containing protein n=1 Tax=Tropicimonas sp. TaxID=2067044 RepID=UPI003A86298C